jgi:hypothetical protein
MRRMRGSGRRLNKSGVVSFNSLCCLGSYDVILDYWKVSINLTAIGSPLPFPFLQTIPHHLSDLEAIVAHEIFVNIKRFVLWVH